MIPVAVFATVMTVIPGFLAGALSVQIRDDLDVGEATYGWALASFFLAAMAGSALLGGLAQRIGPRRQIVAALVVSAATSFVVVALADSFTVFVVALAVSGFANSGNQSAVNLLLTQAQLPRLGLAIAIKQSGMPAASLLGGLSVPAIATTLGWQWVYALCALGAVAAAVTVWSKTSPGPVARKGSRAEPATPRPVLIKAAVGFGLLAYAAGTLNAWIVSSAHDHSGIDERWAGLLLSLGAGLGVLVRLGIGTRIDRSVYSPLRGAALFSLVGAIGVAALSQTSPIAAIAATVLAFGCGWVWPVFTNFGILRANPEAAASATGLTQTGVYIGVFAGPLISGFLIDGPGYGAMWLVTGAVMALGAAVVLAVSPSFVATSDAENEG